MNTAGHITAVLNVLKELLGLGENLGTNDNKIVRWYNKFVSKIGAGPWCEMTVTYAMWNGGAKILKRGRAYTVYGAQDGVNHVNGSSFHYGTKGMRRGDQVYYNWQGKRVVSGIDHTGIVERINGDGTFYVLEGNTSKNKLLRMRRDGKFVVGYVRFDWARIASVAPPKPKPRPAVKKPSSTVSKMKPLQNLLEVTPDSKWDPTMDMAIRRMRNAALTWTSSNDMRKGFPFRIAPVQSIIDSHIDNKWGPDSQSHLVSWVKSFQRLFGLDDDGRWGPKTDNMFLKVRKENYRNY